MWPRDCVAMTVEEDLRNDKDCVKNYMASEEITAEMKNNREAWKIKICCMPHI